MSATQLREVSVGDYVTLGVQITPVEVFEYEGTIFNITDTTVTIETENSTSGDDYLREVDIKISDVQYVH
jgi:hypothetical protein